MVALARRSHSSSCSRTTPSGSGAEGLACHSHFAHVVDSLASESVERTLEVGRRGAFGELVVEMDFMRRWSWSMRRYCLWSEL